MQVQDATAGLQQRLYDPRLEQPPSPPSPTGLGVRCVTVECEVPYRAKLGRHARCQPSSCHPGVWQSALLQPSRTVSIRFRAFHKVRTRRRRIGHRRIESVHCAYERSRSAIRAGGAAEGALQKMLGTVGRATAPLPKAAQVPACPAPGHSEGRATAAEKVLGTESLIRVMYVLNVRGGMCKL